MDRVCAASAVCCFCGYHASLAGGAEHLQLNAMIEKIALCFAKSNARNKQHLGFSLTKKAGRIGHDHLSMCGLLKSAVFYMDQFDTGGGCGRNIGCQGPRWSYIEKSLNVVSRNDESFSGLFNSPSCSEARVSSLFRTSELAAAGSWTVLLDCSNCSTLGIMIGVALESCTSTARRANPTATGKDFICK